MKSESIIEVCVSNMERILVSSSAIYRPRVSTQILSFRLRCKPINDSVRFLDQLQRTLASTCARQAGYVQRALLVHLDSLAGQLEEASRDGHHPGVLRVEGSQECRWFAVEVLLVVDEALREEDYIALGEVVDDGTLTAVLLDERYPQLVAFNRVQHLNKRNTDRTGGVWST